MIQSTLTKAVFTGIRRGFDNGDFTAADIVQHFPEFSPAQRKPRGKDGRRALLTPDEQKLRDRAQQMAEDLGLDGLYFNVEKDLGGPIYLVMFDDAGARVDEHGRRKRPRLGRKQIATTTGSGIRTKVEITTPIEEAALELACLMAK